MGHQFYAQLSGSEIGVFHLELEQDVPDRERAADAAAKAVFYRVVQLLTAGDLKRIHEAVSAAVRTLDGSGTMVELSIATKASVLEQLKRSCIYRDMAGEVATEFMGDTRALRRNLAANAPEDLKACFRAAANVAARQVARPDIVMRLPKDGFLGVRELASDLATRIAARAYRSVARQHRTSPDGYQNKKWHAPRAKSPRRTQAETGAIDVSS